MKAIEMGLGVRKNKSSHRRVAKCQKDLMRDVTMLLSQGDRELEKRQVIDLVILRGGATFQQSGLTLSGLTSPSLPILRPPLPPPCGWLPPLAFADGSPRTRGPTSLEVLGQKPPSPSKQKNLFFLTFAFLGQQTSFFVPIYLLCPVHLAYVKLSIQSSLEQESKVTDHLLIPTPNCQQEDSVMWSWSKGPPSLSTLYLKVR